MKKHFGRLVLFSVWERCCILCFSLLITTRFCSFVNIVWFVEITFEIIPRKLLCCFIQYVASDDVCVRWSHEEEWLRCAGVVSCVDPKEANIVNKNIPSLTPSPPPPPPGITTQIFPVLVILLYKNNFILEYFKFQRNCNYFNCKFYRCERDPVEKQKHCILCSSLYNKREYNLMMADMEAETCSC